MTSTTTPSNWAHEPWWAKAYFRYSQSTPPHRGKSWALRQLLRIGIRRDQPFVWRMLNGSALAISPHEGNAPWSVGWTCFLHRVWEPHIEKLLRSLIEPGDAVMDIGANIGYFSASLSRAVGEKGRVWSFEPVPPTYRQLCIGRETNGFAQMTTFPIALGNTTGEITIRFRKDMMGSASAHLYRDDPDTEAATVAMKRLDDLWAAGEVGLPKLIKIDVEGHERDVIAGALRLITAARPVVVFEYNVAAATAAGWNFMDLAAQFRKCGDYQFFRIHDNRLEKADPATLRLSDSDYADFIASVTDLSGASSAS